MIYLNNNYREWRIILSMDIKRVGGMNKEKKEKNLIWVEKQLIGCWGTLTWKKKENKTISIKIICQSYY